MWPATLRGRFSASLALAFVLLFIIVYLVTALVMGFRLWPSGSDMMTDALVPLGLGGLALAAGLLLGLTLARGIRIPVERFVGYIREQGMAAIEGRAREVIAFPESDLPLELRELGETVEQLLQQLSLRQADLRDVTERALGSEQTFRSVVNASSEVKLLLCEDVIEIANPAAVSFLQRPLGSLLGEPLSAALSAFDITTETGEPLSAEMLLSRSGDEILLVRCLAENGEEQWVECAVTHPQDDFGLSLLTIRDVTERRTLEQLRAEVVSIVSHDLRAPLTVVSGFLEMLGGDISDERRIEIAGKARAATSRMAEMLEDLLDTARVEKNLMPVRWTSVSLGELAADVASSLPTHAEHELVIEQRVDVSVLADAGRLRQALTNVLMNAIQHTPEGTMISLLVDAGPQHALLIVEDGGSGVPEEYRELIFERYARLDDESSGGAGLGLYIVKTIAESHGGSACVEESSGGGARFVIRLPLVPPDAS
ncbi:MAG: HAMP domain-containing sensor histidine kinase [Coriobacteriia bacterium]|nr:HAMP domain-containing sensor histidine kinase [Coriobacteriia bacterium]